MDHGEKPDYLMELLARTKEIRMLAKLEFDLDLPVPVCLKFAEGERRAIVKRASVKEHKHNRKIIRDDLRGNY